MFPTCVHVGQSYPLGVCGPERLRSNEVTTDPITLLGLIRLVYAVVRGFSGIHKVTNGATSLPSSMSITWPTRQCRNFMSTYIKETTENLVLRLSGMHR